MKNHQKLICPRRRRSEKRTKWCTVRGGRLTSPTSEPRPCRRTEERHQSSRWWRFRGVARSRSFQMDSWASRLWCRSMCHAGQRGGCGGDGVEAGCARSAGTGSDEAGQSMCATTCVSVIIIIKIIHITCLKRKISWVFFYVLKQSVPIFVIFGT